MNLILVIKIRLYVLKNCLKRVSVLNVLIFFLFFLSIFFLWSLLEFDNEVTHRINLFKKYDFIRMLNFWSLFNGYLYLKVIIHRNGIKFKGIYSYISRYSNRELDKLYIFYLLDKVIFSIIIFTGFYIFFYGFSKEEVVVYIRIVLLICLISLTEFFSKIYVYMVAKPLKKYIIIFLNLLSSIMCLIVSYYVKFILLILLFLLNFILYKILEYDFREYFKGEIIIQKKMDIFNKIYYLSKKIFISSKISFVLSKEVIQIYNEKLALIYSILYGIIIWLFIPILSININISDIYIFFYFISVSYSIIGISMNLCARDLKKEWIYKLYKITSVDIMIGKFIALYVYAIVVNIFYVFIYKVWMIMMREKIDMEISYYTILVVMIIIVPIAYLVGGILGSYFVPRIKYKYGCIDYSYSGAEVIVLLVTIYIISLPGYLYYRYFICNIWMTLIVIMYQIILLKIFQYRIDIKILKRGN